MKHDLTPLAEAAGFTLNEMSEVETKLKIVEVLVTQRLTRKWMIRSNEFARSEILNCAELLRGALHLAAAEMLQAYAEGLVLDADEMTLRFLRMGEVVYDSAK